MIPHTQQALGFLIDRLMQNVMPELQTTFAMSVTDATRCCLLGPVDFAMTASGLAEAVGVSRQSINELLRGRRAVSPEMSLRLSRLFGNSPEFWLNAQRSVDLWDSAQAIKAEMARIKPLRVA